MKRVENLVIGAGLMGITTAYELIQRGQSVTVIDQLSAPASSASYANAGMLTPSMPEPWNGPGVYKNLVKSLFNPQASMRLRWSAIPDLMSWGMKFLRYSSKSHFDRACRDNYYLTSYSLKKTQELSEKLGLEYCRGKEGTLSIFQEQDDFQGKSNLCDSLRQYGMKCRVIGPDEIISLVPALESMKPKIYKGIHFFNDEFGDAHLFCTEIEKEFIKSGGKVQYNETAEEIVIHDNEVVGVKTNNEFIEADRVVLAAGAVSPKILKKVGLNLDVKPAKGYSLTVHVDNLKKQLPLPVLDDSQNIVFTPLGNRLRMVSTAEFAGFDTSIDQNRIEMMLKSLKKILPSVHELVNESSAIPWAGLRPMSSDGKPFIGWSGIRGLFVNCGQGPLGWTLAMGSANLAADIITEREASIDPELFSLSRSRSS